MRIAGPVFRCGSIVADPNLEIVDGRLAACSHKFVRRLDIIVSSIGAGKWQNSGGEKSKFGLKVEDIDFWEINEAFCIVTLNCIKELGIDPALIGS